MTTPNKSLLRRCRSLVAKPYHGFFHWRYTQRQKSRTPITCRLPRGVEFQLYPEGQIVEPLFVSRFETAELALVAAYLRPGMSVIDVGANVGLYSLLAHRRTGPEGSVVAFEPSSETYARLQNNLRLNRAENVTPERLALSDVPGGQLTLRRDPHYGDGERHIVRAPHMLDVAQAADDRGDVEQVNITTLDHYLNEHRRQAKVDFIKIDVEDHELSVLRGARRTLAANVGIALMLECTPQGCQRAGHTQTDVFRFLREQGLGVYCWLPRQKRWYDSDAQLLQAGNLWALRDRAKLPQL